MRPTVSESISCRKNVFLLENFNKNTFFLHEMDKLTVVLMSIKWLNKNETDIQANPSQQDDVLHLKSSLLHIIVTFFFPSPWKSGQVRSISLIWLFFIKPQLDTSLATIWKTLFSVYVFPIISISQKNFSIFSSHSKK